jgi:hypothetical protein
MARGIYSKWKFPIAYFLTHSNNNKTILKKKLIIDVLNNLIDVGLCSKLIVCDHGTTNQSALKLLDISEDNPFFLLMVITFFLYMMFLTNSLTHLLRLAFKKTIKYFHLKT